jgi:hypothetical protein
MALPGARLIADFTLGIWLVFAFARGGFWKLRDRLTRSQPAAEHTVTAIIPARDECNLIGGAVASLHAQAITPPVRVIVVDDESADGTGAASHADLVVIAGTRPPAWKGKVWAQSRGIEA